MAAFQALRTGALPPAGERIPLRLRARAVAPESLWRPSRAYYYATGTAALAAAIVAAVRALRHRAPEVILPAYGCPALVSAALWAGARPVLVDLEPGRPWLSLTGLEAAIGRDTAAVVAVDLFGIPERIDAIRAVASRWHVPVVEDSAQAFYRRDDGWKGDLVVLSFGRGKPVSLLGGGAVLARNPDLARHLPELPPRPAGAARLRAKVLAYNLLRQPALYWLPAAIPALKLGATRYEPLEAVEPIDRVRLDALAAAVEAYEADDAQLQRQRRIQAALRGSALEDLARLCGAEGFRLLRYPLLAPTAAQRDALVDELTAAGLGASRMYAVPLSRVEAIPSVCRGLSTPVAEDFAARLLTLPTHSHVTSGRLERLRILIHRHADLSGQAVRLAHQ